MSQQSENDFTFLWFHATIALIDVRPIALDSGEPFIPYTLPTSGFLVTLRGNARLLADKRIHEAKRAHVLHGPKGTKLLIQPLESYYACLILYRSGPPAFAKRRWQSLLEQRNPFAAHYAVSLHASPFALASAETMCSQWYYADRAASLQVKAHLYQLVSAVANALGSDSFGIALPDRVVQAQQYMQDHYTWPITLESLSEQLECSSRYLTRLFKERGLSSPMRHLQDIRTRQACLLLRDTSCTLQTIAEQTGYTDSYTFSRSFKRTLGISPDRYRLNCRLGQPVPKLSLPGSESAIADDLLSPYILYDNDFHYRYNPKGVQFMPSTKRKSITAVLVLGATLLLGACGSANNTVNPVHSAESSAAATETAQASKAQAAEPTVRTYTDFQGRNVEIPTNPQRVVIQGNNAGDLWALGLEPVGIDRRYTENYDSLELYHESAPAEDIGFPTNFEKVMSLEPDLLLLGYSMENQLEQASKIAPVVSYRQELSLHERLPIVADIVGKQNEAVQILKDYDEKAARMWQQLRADGTVKPGDSAVILMYYWNKSMYIIKNGGLHDLLYQPDGFTMDPTVDALQPNQGNYIEVAEESLPELLVGDHLFVLYPYNDDAKEGFSELLKTKLWSQLPQVRNQRIHFVDSNLNYTDPFVSLRLVEELPKLMTE